MRNPLFRFPHRIGAFLASALVLVAASALAAPERERDILDRFRDRARVGMEVELTELDLARFIRNFDLDDYNRYSGGTLTRHAPIEFIDDYLDSRTALESLPAPWRARLTAGLSHLDDPPLVAPAPVKAETKASTDLIVPPGPRGAEGLALPRAAKPVAAPLLHMPSKEPPSKDLALFESAHDWAVLRARWKALPEAARRSVVKPSRFPAAWLAERVVAEGLHGLDIHPSASAEARELFSALEWNTDQGKGYVEFRHREDRVQTDLKQYLDQLERFTRLTGVHGTIWSRGKPDAVERRTGRSAFPTSYHLHLSVPGVHMEPIAERLNLLKVFQAAGEGHHPLASNKDDYYVSFTAVETRGLIRLVSDDRIELRFHSEDPATELRNTLSYIEDPSVLDRELARAVTVERLEKLFPEKGSKTDEWKFNLFIEKLKEASLHCPDCRFISPEVGVWLEARLSSPSVANRLTAVTLTDALGVRPGSLLLSRARSALDGILDELGNRGAPDGKGPATLVGMRTVTKMLLRLSPSVAGKKAATALLGDPKALLDGDVLRALLKRSDDPHVLAALVELLECPIMGVSGMAQSLLRDKALPPSSVERLIEMLDAPRVSTRVSAVELLGHLREDPKVLERVVDILRETEPDPVLVDVVEKVLARSREPKVAVEMIRLLAKPQSMGARSAERVLARGQWSLPAEAQREALALWPKMGVDGKKAVIEAFPAAEAISRIEEDTLKALEAAVAGESHPETKASLERLIGRYQARRNCLREMSEMMRAFNRL